MDFLIRKAEPENAKAIRAAILLAVNPVSNPDFSDQGVQTFLKPNDVGSIRQRISDPDYLTLCAFCDEQIVGVITMRQFKTIDQLFVTPQWQGRGIASQLWREARRQCEKNGNRGVYSVCSSTIAVPVYQRFGFYVSGERKSYLGITYYPMICDES